MDKYENLKIYSPYNDHPYLFVFNGPVLVKIFPQTFIITIFSILIVALWEYTNIKLGISSYFITITTFVVSLLLAYRTNTAYDRYWEGRCLWSTMVTSIRNLARYIWVNVPSVNKTNEVDPEKLVAFDLLAGFAVATKHYLREEDGMESSKVHLDMQPLKKDIEKKDKTRSKNICYRKKKSQNRKLVNAKLIANHNLPLEISLYLNYYIGKLSNRESDTERIDSSTTVQMYLCVETLVGCLTSLERVLRSPIPLAYAVHSLHTTWIFCLSLPFQLVEDLEWVTVPIVFLSSLILLGIEEIAREIENPFGTDPNDIKLDDFCSLLEMEMEFVKEHKTMEDHWKESIEKKISEIKESNKLVTIE